MLTDPKAIKYILHSAGHHYPKTAEKTQLLKLIAGNGIVAAEGLQPFRHFSIAAHHATVQDKIITVNGRL